MLQPLLEELSRSNTPLLQACVNDQLAVCEWLCTVGAAKDVRAANHEGYTPMLLACLGGQLAVCEWLFAKASSTAKKLESNFSTTIALLFG